MPASSVIGCRAFQSALKYIHCQTVIKVATEQQGGTKAIHFINAGVATN